MSEKESVWDHRAWDLALKALVPIVMGISGYVVSIHASVIANDKAIRVLEIRVGDRDGWLKEDMQELKAMVRELNTRVRSLEMKKGG